MADITLYSVLFDSALSKLRDYALASLGQDDCYAVLQQHLRPACVKFRVCKQALGNRDDVLQEFPFILTDTEIEILSNEIVINYIYANHIKTPLLLKMSLPSSDFRAFSQSNFLKGLLELHDTLKRENEQLISQYSWDNATLYETLGADGGTT